MAPWQAHGTVLVGCNCDYGCPCNFQAPPTTGSCEGEWAWHIDEGHCGDVDLAGVTFVLAVNWPGAIHEGGGEGLLLVDERTDQAQREVVSALARGEGGGPWGVMAWTWPVLHGPEAVPVELHLDGVRSRLRAGDGFELGMAAIRNPVTGAEVTPGAVLPQGSIFTRGDFAATTRFRVDRLGIDHSDSYAAVAAFSYAGP